MHDLHQTYHQLRNCFGCSRWNSKATWVKWKLILLHLEIVLILAQDRCTVCAECTMGMEIIVVVPNGTPGTWVKGRLVSVRLEIVLVSTQDRCTVCAKHVIGSKVILGAPDGTPT